MIPTKNEVRDALDFSQTVIEAASRLNITVKELAALCSKYGLSSPGNYMYIRDRREGREGSSRFDAVERRFARLMNGRSYGGNNGKSEQGNAHR